MNSLSSSSLSLTTTPSPLFQTVRSHDEVIQSTIERLIPERQKQELALGRVKGICIQVEGTDVWIPRQFLQGEPLQEICGIFDVDGVVRLGTKGRDAFPNPRVLENIQTLLRTNRAFIAFISGSPAANDQGLEEWRRGNVPLTEVFGSVFSHDIQAGRVEIFGGFGGQKVTPQGRGELVDGYTLECSFELTRMMIRVFLEIVVDKYGPTSTQGEAAQKLLQSLLSVRLGEGPHQTDATALEFEPIVRDILRDIDPGFRIINNGPSVAMKCPQALRGVRIAPELIQEKMNQAPCLASLAPMQKQVSSGIEKRDGIDFTYVVVSKTNKEPTTQKIIAQAQRILPHAFHVSFGDGAADYQMHKYASLAFHVGSSDIYTANPLSQCVMVSGPNGEDKRYVDGTAEVLQRLIEGFGKSFYDFQYIPKRSVSGMVRYCSLRELLVGEAKTTENITKHYERVRRYFPGAELATIMTDETISKDLSDIRPSDLRGGLWEANWSRNVLTWALKHPDQENRIISLFLNRIAEIEGMPPSFFILPVDYGKEPMKESHSISVRLLAHLVGESESVEFAKLSPETKAMIQRAALPFNGGRFGVASRIAQQQERKHDFNGLFPAPEFEKLRTILLPKSEEFSPKHSTQLILDLEIPTERNALMRQYLEVLSLHRETSLSSQLMKQLKIDVAEYVAAYPRGLDADIIDLCARLP